MRRLFALVLASALALAACVPSSQTPHTTGTELIEYRTVALVKGTENGIRAYCTGVWVANESVLTANHCVDSLDVGDRVGYVTRGDLSAADGDEAETVRFGALARRDEVHDLALLGVKLPPKHGVAGVGTATVGQWCQTMGHPLGLWWSYSTGMVSGLRVLDLDKDGHPALWVQATAPISPGNSGGGLFDVDGNLVGIADFYLPRGENLNFFVHPKYIEAFLAPTFVGQKDDSTGK